MSELSPLLNDTASGLSYRTLASTPPQPTSLVVLLHGVGGDESNLATLAAAVPRDTLVVLVRGRLRLQPGFGWFHVSFTANGPSIAVGEAEQSRKALISLIAQLQTRYGIAPTRSVIGGFSQGGILSASVGLSAPQLVGGFAVLSGRILPEIESAIAPLIALAGSHAFISHGRQDTTLPVTWATRSQSWLTNLRVPHELKLFDGGHELTEDVAKSFEAWLKQRLSAPLPLKPMHLDVGNDATTVRSLEEQTTHRVAPGVQEIVELHLTKSTSLEAGIEWAIAAVEEDVMAAPRSLHGRALESRDKWVIAIAQAAGLRPQESLCKAGVEQVFARRVAVAMGRPAASENLPEGLEFVAALVIVRELMHHLGVDEISMPLDARVA